MLSNILVTIIFLLIAAVVPTLVYLMQRGPTIRRFLRKYCDYRLNKGDKPTRCEVYYLARQNDTYKTLAVTHTTGDDFVSDCPWNRYFLVRLYYVDKDGLTDDVWLLGCRNPEGYWQRKLGGRSGDGFIIYDRREFNKWGGDGLRLAGVSAQSQSIEELLKKLLAITTKYRSVTEYAFDLLKDGVVAELQRLQPSIKSPSLEELRNYAKSVMGRIFDSPNPEFVPRSTAPSE